VRALLETCQPEERTKEAEARDRALTITGPERAFEVDDMVDRLVSDGNVEADFRLDEAGLRALEAGSSIPVVVRLGDRNRHWHKDVTQTEVLLIALWRLRRCNTHRELGNAHGLRGGDGSNSWIGVH
jgi:hypothetical protein